MPYIAPEARPELDHAIANCIPRDAGELQYVIARIIKQHMATRTVRYQVLNDVLGALEGAKQEFYRRVVVPYEDSKIHANGDVYTNYPGRGR